VKYAIETVSVAMIYIPIFVKIDSRTGKLMRWGRVIQKHTDGMDIA
jgi:hypothetical protein